MTRFRSHRHLPQILHRVRYTKELPHDLRTILARRRYKPVSPESELAKALAQRQSPEPTSRMGDSDVPSSQSSTGHATVTKLRQVLVPSDGQVQVISPSLIPKPAGEAGRPNAGGYSLDAKLKELGWSSEDIENMQVCRFRSYKSPGLIYYAETNQRPMQCPS